PRDPSDVRRGAGQSWIEAPHGRCLRGGNRHPATQGRVRRGAVLEPDVLGFSRAPRIDIIAALRFYPGNRDAWLVAPGTTPAGEGVVRPHMRACAVSVPAGVPTSSDLDQR